MEIEFDAAKDAANRVKHGISLAAAGDMNLDQAVIVEDRRLDYAETRLIAYGRIGNRLHVLWFTWRGETVRAIGLRKANQRERNTMTGHPEKPEHISQEDWDSVDVPELTDEEMARAVPFKDALPELYDSWKRSKGRPKIAQPKKQFALRMAADVVDAVRASGKDYNSRVEKVLRDALARGIL